ncbi:hypothetical protein KEH51_12630 [[Brevibacterium] frigoritolerans]|uniref:Uncharacterized protein n=1 Tax=Peribacillus frigoritolerans TaxID=450367 RepID=A0A941FJ19_9BACI|nr:hypothetical protein [Peribacillus frigoritolerans]
MTGNSITPMGLQAESKDIGDIVINTSEEPMYGNMVWEAVFAKKNT